MSDDGEEHAETNLLGELSELGGALKPLLRRLPNARKAIDKLTGGLAVAGAKALESRLHLYRTGNLVNEAGKVAGATGLPAPFVFDALARQRQIDELTIDALRRVDESVDVQDEDTAAAAPADSDNTTDRWFRTLYEEAGAVDEEDVREGFVRILAGEIQTPGSFSLRTLRVMGGVSRSTAQCFRRAASVSVRLMAPDGKHVIDARIPAIGGGLGQNILQSEGLSYGVLTDLTENGLVHSDYNSRQSYGPLELPPAAQQHFPDGFQMPFAHQGTMWVLVPQGQKKAKPVGVDGAQFTSCGVELLKIVDIESLPDFTAKLVRHFAKSGYQMVQLP